jgi:nucleoside-diphosphate-sugar epimerase
MASGIGSTAFVTGAAGFIGRELVHELVARGHHVFGLARSVESARHLRRAGAIAVKGDLLAPGGWQDEAAADWVFHIPPRGHMRGRMDTHLFDAVASGGTRRIVYVADAICGGATGARPITEDELPAPDAGGRSIVPELDRVNGYVIAGLPIVTALPGCVYGDASWFREFVVDPVMAGGRVWQFGMEGTWVSPIHVHDCARALVHLAERGSVGGRYFLANDEPIRMPELAQTFARVANRPLRVRRLPPGLARLVVNRPLSDYVRANAALSNIRLRGSGFRFRYPTLEQGMAQILGALDE